MKISQLENKVKEAENKTGSASTNGAYYASLKSLKFWLDNLHNSTIANPQIELTDTYIKYFVENNGQLYVKVSNMLFEYKCGIKPF